MIQTPITTIFFDLDGTLIDTELTAALALSACFAEWKIEILPEDAHFVTGRTWGSAFEFLFAKYSIPVPQSEAKQIILNRYRESLEKELCTVPGSVEAVRLFSSRYPLAVVSGSHRKDILWAIQKLSISHCFQFVLGAEDYPRSKPQPDSYLLATEKMGVSPRSCLVFEDSEAGIEAARTAGLWVIAVTSTNRTRQNLSRAHLQIQDLTDVSLDWIQELSLDSGQNL